MNKDLGKVIKYLSKYRIAHLERMSVYRRVKELRLKYEYPQAIRYSDMPKAHDVEHDLSEFAAQLEELEVMLDDKAVKCLTLETDILCRIELIEDYDEREILRAEFIDLDPKTFRRNSMDTVARRLHYSRRQAYRIRRKALRHFPMPQDGT